MIDIFVSGRQLTIPVDTSITIEQSAPWANYDSISTDIAWTFDIPAEPNQQLLDFAGFTIVSNHKNYPCEFRFDGVPIATGNLYVQQSADQKSLSCGAVLSNYLDDWASALLSANDYGSPTEIATSADNYRQGWLNFLKASLDPKSMVKFFLFVDQDFLSDNEDYGYHLGHLSHLQNSGANTMMSKLINRLFFDSDNNIVTSPAIPGEDGIDTQLQGLRIFNESDGMASDAKVNGFHFCPAFRLDNIVRRAFQSAGKATIGNFLEDANIKNLFIQSMRSMDGNLLQYPIVQNLSISGGISPSSTEPATVQHSFPISIGGSSAAALTFDSISQNLALNFKLTLPCLTTDSGSLSEGTGRSDHYDEVFFLVLRQDNETALPRYRANLNSNSATDAPSYVYGNTKTKAYYTSLGYGTSLPIYDADFLDNNYSGTSRSHVLENYNSALLLQLTPSLRNEVSFGSNSTEFYQGTDSLNLGRLVGTSTSAPFYAQLVRAKVKTWSEDSQFYNILSSDNQVVGIQCLLSFSYIEELYDYEVIDQAAFDYCEPRLNVFSRYLDYSEHMPSVSNSEFISNLCKFFGLQFWFSKDNAQLSFFKDIFKAQSFDITEFVSSEKKLTYSPSLMNVSISPVDSAPSASDSRFLPSVVTSNQLPLPQTRNGRYAFVEAENRHRYAEYSEDEDGNKRWSWSPVGGTRDTVAIGDQSLDPTDTYSDILVPNMRIIDSLYTPKYISECGHSGCSSMFQRDFKGEFPIIINQYRGKRLLNLQAASNGVRSAYIEDANPTNFNPDGSVDSSFISLTMSGTRSVGEMWQRPYYQFLATAEDVEFTLHLPADKFLSLYQLMLPQNGPESSHTRWLHYRGQRYLPKKISYQLSSSSTVIATVTASRQHFED